MTARMTWRPVGSVAVCVVRMFFLLLVAATFWGVQAKASIGLLVGEPFGAFGTMMPQGHAGVWMDHLCADTPTAVRPCAPGELGVVVSRFHDLRQTGLDWLAMPASVFLYGVDDLAEAPIFVTPALRDRMRERYRSAHLAMEVPDRAGRHGEPRPPAYGDWDEAIGATFDRRLFLYVFDTTSAQDAAVARQLNEGPNRRRYTLTRANCADFALDLLSIPLPGVLHRNRVADFDMTTPKHLARLLDNYGAAHPELHPRVFEIPQLPGSVRRSRPIRGAAESLLTTKRYLVTLLAIQPEVPLLALLAYERRGRWVVGRDAVTLQAGAWPTDFDPTPDKELSGWEALPEPIGVSSMGAFAACSELP